MTEETYVVELKLQTFRLLLFVILFLVQRKKYITKKSLNIKPKIIKIDRFIKKL